MTAPTSVDEGATLDARSVAPGDLPALAELLVVAYTGTVDDLQQTPAEALEELEHFASGREVGPPLWECSFLTPASSAALSAVLTTLEGGRPLLGYIYTHPDAQGRGLATGLITRARQALAERGFQRVALRVAIANERARRLYERLGFAAE